MSCVHNEQNTRVKIHSMHMVFITYSESSKLLNDVNITNTNNKRFSGYSGM